MKTITEQSAIIDVEETEIATRDMDVFYNPKMKHNRDVSVALLASLKNPVKTIGLPMCATGVRAIRFAKELSGDLTITANDLSPLAISRAKQFAKKNGVSITWSQGQSDLFFCNSTGLDYIDIDPFGSPNPFLDMAMKRLNRGGILAVSATDTAALCGTSDAACIRKYNGKTSRSELKYEAGVRILIRKVQEVGAQYDKALTPILCYYKEHYIRLYLYCKKGKILSDNILKQHGTIVDPLGASVGPLWLGPLYDFSYFNANKFFLGLREMNTSSRWTDILESEYKNSTFGYYHIPSIASRLKLEHEAKIDVVISLLPKADKATKTIQCLQAVRTKTSTAVIERILKKLSKKETVNK